MHLLITGAWQGAKQHFDMIKNMGHEVIFLQQEKDPLPCAYTWVEGTVCNGLFLHHPVEKFENLKYVQVTSAGLDRLPAALLEAEDLELHNARGVYSIPMAEYALGGVLQLYRQFSFFRENQKQGVWEKRRDLRELSGKTVCIVGCGSVGCECAKRFRAFDCRILGVDVCLREDSLFDSILPVAALNQALAEADVLVLTLPLTEQTRHLMDADRFAVIKSGAVLINIARGAIVDTAALVTALKKGHLSGAVLDVFEEEPLGTDSPLWDLENVVITPHNSFVGDQVQQRLTDVILSNLKQRKTD